MPWGRVKSIRQSQLAESAATSAVTLTSQATRPVRRRAADKLGLPGKSKPRQNRFAVLQHGLDQHRPMRPPAPTMPIRIPFILQTHLFSMRPKIPVPRRRQGAALSIGGQGTQVVDHLVFAPAPSGR